MAQQGIVTVCDDEDKYRFGFNGVEKDNSLRGNGNSYDFKFRGYDARLGRFTSGDPLAAKYPWNSTYAFAENDVIRCKDIEGLEKAPSISAQRDNTAAAVPVQNALTIRQQSQMAQKAALNRAYAEYLANEQAANLEGRVFEDNLNHKRQYQHEDAPAGVTVPNMKLRDRIKAGFGMAAPAFVAGAPQLAAGNAASAGNGLINLNNTSPQTGEAFGTTISDGLINVNGRAVTRGRFDFVVTKEGEIVLGQGHSYMSGGQSVQAAGTMNLYKGRITELTNNSGHYLPTVEQGENSLNVLNQSGAATSGAKVKMYGADGSLQKSYRAE